MNSWDTTENGSDARARATIAFCEKLKNMGPHERSRFTLPQPTPELEQAAMDGAKALFADRFFFLEGDPNNTANLRPIPAALPFRVYEEGFPPGSPDRPWFDDRDDIVTMVLPHPGVSPGRDASEYYRCSYFPYLPEPRRNPFALAREKAINQSSLR